MFENILVWASLIADTKYYEEGGRQDYPLAAKLEDLRTIREAMSLIGWSTATVRSSCAFGPAELAPPDRSRNEANEIHVYYRSCRTSRASPASLRTLRASKAS